jgi:lipopolysaccharide transport system ATP-binding protein
MSAAITVENLGKKYRITHETRNGTRSYRTFRESITNACAAPFRRLRNGVADDASEDFWALKDVNFEVKPGEVVGIIGRNGAGKSTLLKILSRITKPTTGRVTLNGRVGSLLEVGTGFHPELTGRENIYLNGSILGMSRTEIAKRFDEIVAFAEVEKFLDTPVKRYSSGMYVRLAFAVAAHLEPEILIVDEVLAVGDAGFQLKCLRKMRECASSGRTVLLVSHHMTTMRELCEQVVWLASGEVQMVSRVKDVVDKYLDASDVLTQPEQWVDLREVTRVGHGPARIVRASYEGATSHRPPTSDGCMKLAVDVAVPEGMNLTSMLVEFQLMDKFQNKLLSVTTFERRQPLLLKAGINRVSFVVNEIHLAPAQYPLNIVLGDLEDVHDSITSAMRIQIVEPSDGRFNWTDRAPVTSTSSYSVSRPS